MPKPGRFIRSSDFASLGNDDNKPMALTLSDGEVINPGAERVFQTLATVGNRDAVLYAELLSSRFPSRPTPTIQLFINIRMRYEFDGVVREFPTTASLRRTSSRMMALEVVIVNPYGFTLTIAEAQTIEARVSTMLSPFN